MPDIGRFSFWGVALVKLKTMKKYWAQKKANSLKTTSYPKARKNKMK